jgi:AcrR family transcriptional regulator
VPTKSKEIRPRTLDREVRREEILRAAARVFAQKGYHVARISDVADVAGVAQGTIYRFFSSKEEIASSLARNGISRLEALLARATESAQAMGEPARALDIFIDEAATFYYEHRHEVAALHSWSLDPSTRTVEAGTGQRGTDRVAKEIRAMMRRAGAQLWRPPGIDVSRLILVMLYSLSSQMELYGATTGSAQIAQTIRKIVYVENAGGDNIADDS